MKNKTYFNRDKNNILSYVEANDKPSNYAIEIPFNARRNEYVYTHYSINNRKTKKHLFIGNKIILSWGGD